MKKLELSLGVTLALGVLLAPMVAVASAPAPPRWIAALYIDAQTAVRLRGEPGPGASGYKVLRSTAKGKDHREIAAVDKPQHFDMKIEPGGTYYYKLQTVAGNETSVLSEEREVIVPGQKKTMTDSLLDFFRPSRIPRQTQIGLSFWYGMQSPHV